MIVRLVLESRPALVRMALWSLAASAPAILAGRLVASAVDQGFLAGDPWLGTVWLGVLGAVYLVSASGARRVPVCVGEVVEPIRDRLTRDVVGATLRRAVAAPGPVDSAAVARLTGHVEIVRDLTAGLLSNLQQVVFTMGGAILGLLWLDGLLAITVVAPVAAAMAVLMAMLPGFVRRHRAQLVADERLASSVSRIFTALRDVVGAGAEGRAEADAASAAEESARAARGVARSAAIRRAISAFGGQVPLLALLLSAPLLLRRGELSGGELAGAVTYVTVSLQPALRSAVQSLGVSGVRLAVTLRRLTDTMCAPAPRKTAGHRWPGRFDLVAERVTFAYGAIPVVRGLDLTIRHGEHLAMVGPSGIGKSTLADLLTGLVAPAEGVIRLGGLPLDELGEPWLRRTVALIPQQAYIFRGSLRENLTYLRSEADPDSAVQELGLRHLVERLGGYDAVIGPGTALSAGERQLIALARVWLSPAEIVVLDEATCHLDPAAEDRAERAFRRRRGTLVVVAHRLSSALRADRILAMDGRGTVVGTHAELIARSDLYADLAGAWDSHRSS